MRRNTTRLMFEAPEICFWKSENVSIRPKLNEDYLNKTITDVTFRALHGKISTNRIVERSWRLIIDDDSFIIWLNISSVTENRRTTRRIATWKLFDIPWEKSQTFEDDKTRVVGIWMKVILHVSITMVSMKLLIDNECIRYEWWKCFFVTLKCRIKVGMP